MVDRATQAAIDRMNASIAAAGWNDKPEPEPTVDPAALAAQQKALSLTQPSDYSLFKPGAQKNLQSLFTYLYPPELRASPQETAPAAAQPTMAPSADARAPAAAPVAAPVAAPAAAPVQAAPLMTAYGMTQPNIPMNIGHPSIQQMAVPTSMRETAPPTWSAAAQTAAERAAPVASPATAAAARHISTMPSVIDMNTRPAINRGQPIDMTSGANSPGFLSRLFSGPSYQSTGDKVVGDAGKVNWGSSDSAADFVRADRASMAQQQAPSSGDNDDGKKRGGAVDGKKGKDEAIHKALEIIHHLLRGH